MTKTVIRETIIALLVCLAILLILSVVLYNYIPGNKVVPEAVEYVPTQEIQTQLNAAVEDSSNDIIMTYEITAQDLERYEKTNEYVPGKSNPFATVGISDDNTDGNNTDNNSQNNGNSNSGTSNGSTNSGTSNNNSSGSLFEDGTSK